MTGNKLRVGQIAVLATLPFAFWISPCKAGGPAVDVTVDQDAYEKARALELRLHFSPLVGPKLNRDFGPPVADTGQTGGTLSGAPNATSSPASPSEAGAASPPDQGGVHPMAQLANHLAWTHYQGSGFKLDVPPVYDPEGGRPSNPMDPFPDFPPAP